MRISLLVTTVILCVSSVLYWVNAHPEKPLVEYPSKTANQSLSTVDVNPVKAVSDSDKTQINDFLTMLKDVPLADLKSSLDVFWQRCRLLQSCELWLQQIKVDMDESRYQIFASYPEKKQQLIESMGHDFKPHKGNLSDHVGQIKQKYHDVYGELSEHLFANEYALYHYKEKVAAIYADNIDTDLSHKVEILDALFKDMSTQQNSLPELPSYLSPQSQYQQALSFIDQAQSAQLIEQQQQFLAQHYLPAEEAQAVILRQQQISEQHIQRQQYQQDFSRFQQQLSEQRIASFSNLSESDWKNYQEQKIFEFRRDYFK